MNPWFGKVFLLVGLIASIAIRVPHDKISQQTKVIESRRGRQEIILLALMGICTALLPVLYIFTSLLGFADYPLHAGVLALGVLIMAVGLWLFRRSHVDLGRNWSVSLELREDHKLVTDGVYRQVRHPMYTALYLYALAQVLLLPNWLAGPAMLVSFTFMCVLRVPQEERMMLEKFGEQYLSYMKRTKRIAPGVY